MVSSVKNGNECIEDGQRQGLSMKEIEQYLKHWNDDN